MPLQIQSGPCSRHLPGARLLTWARLRAGTREWMTSSSWTTAPSSSQTTLWTPTTSGCPPRSCRTTWAACAPGLPPAHGLALARLSVHHRRCAALVPACTVHGHVPTGACAPAEPGSVHPPRVMLLSLQGRRGPGCHPAAGRLLSAKLADGPHLLRRGLSHSHGTPVRLTVLGLVQVYVLPPAGLPQILINSLPRAPNGVALSEDGATLCVPAACGRRTSHGMCSTPHLCC